MSLDASERHGIDLSRSVMVGDSWNDMELGWAVGCRVVLVGPDKTRGSPGNTRGEPDAIVSDLLEAARPIIGD